MTPEEYDDKLWGAYHALLRKTGSHSFCCWHDERVSSSALYGIIGHLDNHSPENFMGSTIAEAHAAFVKAHPDYAPLLLQAQIIVRAEDPEQSKIDAGIDLTTFPCVIISLEDDGVRITLHKSAGSTYSLFGDTLNNAALSFRNCFPEYKPYLNDALDKEKHHNHDSQIELNVPVEPSDPEHINLKALVAYAELGRQSYGAGKRILANQFSKQLNKLTGSKAASNLLSYALGSIPLDNKHAKAIQPEMRREALAALGRDFFNSFCEKLNAELQDPAPPEEVIASEVEIMTTELTFEKELNI